MECQSCGAETKINYGNSDATLCEDCMFNSEEELISNNQVSGTSKENISTTNDDEDAYLIATEETENGTKDPAIWAKAMALTEGDEKKSKYKYIQLRVEKILENKKNKPHSHTAKKESPDKQEEIDSTLLEEGYITATQFSKKTGISHTKVVKMIKDGFYSGRIKGETWYISESELDNTKTNTKRKRNQKRTESHRVTVGDGVRAGAGLFIFFIVLGAVFFLWIALSLNGMF